MGAIETVIGVWGVLVLVFVIAILVNVWRELKADEADLAPSNEDEWFI